MIDSVKGLILNVFDKLKSESIIVTDLYLTFCLESACITIFDDNNNELSSAVLKLDNSEEIDSEYILDIIKADLAQKEVQDAFRKLDYSYPISVLLLSDDDYSELATYDSNNIYIHDDILDNMFKELDDFIEKTLSDI